MPDINHSCGKNILIIEDDKKIAELISLHLNDLNYQTGHCENGRIGYETALGDDYDLIILDLMLPELDGYEICRKLRDQNNYVPILMLSSRAEELDRVLGLELGADDYLTKPFSIRELIARVKAIFRRLEVVSNPDNSDSNKKVLSFDELEVDLGNRRVLLNSNPIELTVKEFDLLELFAKTPGRAYSRQDLLNIVWGYQFDGYDHTVNSHINRLRSKIEKDPSHPQFIKTVWGFGYRFMEREELDQ